MSEPEYPGAVAPERTSRFRSGDVGLHLSKWGDPEAPPLLLCHGMFDNGRGFDLLAPLLAERFHVLALDSRGHGESDWSDAYHWPVDVRDVVEVLRSLGRPAHLLGHSRGGGQVTDAASCAPELVRQLINIDGFGPPPEGFEWPGREPEPVDIVSGCARYLDQCRIATQRGGWRPYASLENLVERRRAQNPRLSREWLRYFVFHCARHDEDGWTWKVDSLAGNGFGPWRPDWIAPVWKTVRAPLLAITGSEPDTWGPLPEPLIEERLIHVDSFERAVIPDAGHFVHMERPRETARVVLEFLEA